MVAQMFGITGKDWAVPEVAGSALQGSPAARQLGDAVAVQRAQNAADDYRLRAHPHPGSMRLVLRTARRKPLW